MTANLKKNSAFSEKYAGSSQNLKLARALKSWPLKHTKWKQRKYLRKKQDYLFTYDNTTDYSKEFCLLIEKNKYRTGPWNQQKKMYYAIHFQNYWN